MNVESSTLFHFGISSGATPTGEAAFSGSPDDGGALDEPAGPDFRNMPHPWIDRMTAVSATETVIALTDLGAGRGKGRSHEPRRTRHP
jgi:hypothetical protein